MEKNISTIKSCNNSINIDSEFQYRQELNKSKNLRYPEECEYNSLYNLKKRTCLRYPEEIVKNSSENVKN